jgi:hypothetical protein
MEYSINKDWVQLHTFYTFELSSGIFGRYKLEKQNYSTRQFKNVFYVFDKEEHIATITNGPYNNVLHEKSTFIKFENRILYTNYFYNYMLEILKDLGLKFRNITRFDLCIDFNKFKNNLNPQTFIQRFISGTYDKVINSKFKVIGTHGHVNKFEYINFGTENSLISYKMYNKKLELEQSKMKPYIIDSAKDNGIDTAQDFWRLEFSIKCSNTKYLSTEGQILYDAKDLNSIRSNYHFELLQHLISHYFNFVQGKKKQRKDRMTPLPLFDFGKKKLIIYNNDDSKESNRSDKIFAKKLMQLNQELRGIDFDNYIFSRQLLTQFVYNRGLEEWAEKKEIDIMYQTKLNLTKPCQITRKISPIFFSKVNV